MFYYFRYGVEVPLSAVGLIGTNYITMSIFLAFAVIYPDMEVMLYFILPIKMKWMALVYVVLAGYDFINGGIGIRVAIGASLLNFVIFFLSTRNYRPASQLPETSERVYPLPAWHHPRIS